MINGVQRTVTNVNQTVESVGSAADVAAHELPQLTNNVQRAVDDFNQHAGGIRNTLDDGVARLNQQGDALNNNLHSMVNLIDNQSSLLNQNVDRHLNELNAQVGELNGTADRAVGEMESAVDAIERTANEISGAVEKLEPSLGLFLDILGPLQAIMGGYYIILSLKMLGVLNTRNQPESYLWREIRETNRQLRRIADENREASLPQIVERITRKSMLFDESTNTMNVYFFYSQNNSVVHQLKGRGYFAYVTITELMKMVYIWNQLSYLAFSEINEEDHTGQRRPFIHRRTIIHFLDSCPKATIRIPKLECTKIHQSVMIVNHFEAVQHVMLESVKVLRGCSIELESVTVCKIDATDGGRAKLKRCEIGWEQKLAPPVPFLFGGPKSDFKNPYHVCGTVLYDECKTYNKLERREQPSTKFKSRPGSCVCEIKKSKVSKGDGTITIKGTITNISDTVWHVQFKSDIKKISFVTTQDSTPDLSSSEQRDGYILVPPFGNCVNYSLTCPRGFIPSVLGAYGTLVFADKDKCEYHHVYKKYSLITDFTITSPSILGGNGLSHHAECIYSARHTDCDTILVVGCSGSGKSTFLNTLAGVYWTVQSDEQGAIMETFVSKGRHFTEKFETSRGVTRCTKSACASDIDTFDGRKMTVIDTVGYETTVSHSNFLGLSNLTEVMLGQKEISAVVIVANCHDNRLTPAFVESLVCLPQSFKAQIQKNIILVFSKWTYSKEQTKDIEQHDGEYRGLDPQIQVVATALGTEPDKIKIFWMDNGPLVNHVDDTINSMIGFLDHVGQLPRISCQRFQEMRALGQLGSAVREELDNFFHSSKSNPSRYELFLDERVRFHSAKIPKYSVVGSSPVDWGEELVHMLEKDVKELLPKVLANSCVDVMKSVDLQLPETVQLAMTPAEKVKDLLANGLFYSGILAAFCTIPLTTGASLLAVPLALLVQKIHSSSWSRKDVIPFIVESLTEHEKCMQLCSQFKEKFTDFVDKKAKQIEEILNSVNQ